jgi:hypothetical protein
MDFHEFPWIPMNFHGFLTREKGGKSGLFPRKMEKFRLTLSSSSDIIDIILLLF